MRLQPPNQKSKSTIDITYVSQSEKKYKTKAAQEYKRHLSKLQNDERGVAALNPVTTEGIDASKSIATKWESSSGLDDMMLSLSGKEREPTSIIPVPSVIKAEPTQSDSAFPDDDDIAPPAPQFSEPKAKPLPMAPAAAIGTLSVSSLNKNADDKDGFGDFDNVPTRLSKAPVFGKKGVAPKKSSATRMMSTSAADERFESFESIEQRATKAVQEADDHKMATQLQTQENNNNNGGESGGSSRLAAIYQESEAASIYRASATPAATSSSIYSSSKFPDSSASHSQGSSNTGGSSFNVAASSESYAARNKYSSNKGISSDQFFGRDEEDMQIMKNRLEKLSSSSAIGSDMLSNDDAANDWQSGDHRGGRSSGSSGSGGYSSSNAYSGNNIAISSTIVNAKLKDMVTNFIGDIQSRLA